LKVIPMQLLQKCQKMTTTNSVQSVTRYYSVSNGVFYVIVSYLAVQFLLIVHDVKMIDNNKTKKIITT